MSYGGVPGQPAGYGGPGYGGFGYRGPGYGGYGGEPAPSNHLVWAILTTLFCCLPAGIVSIVYAAQVNSKWAGGDYQGAMDSSRKAGIWAVVSACASVVGVIIWVIALAAVRRNSTTP
jgi:hypothetical protein